MEGSIRKGLKWNAIGQAVSQFCVIIGSIVLARILSPKEFGTVAMVTIISSFATMFMDMGFSQGLIQRKDINDNQLSSIFWLNNAIGCFFFVLFLLGAPLIAIFYETPILSSLTRAISITFLLGAIPQIPRVLLTRKMDFKKISLVTIFSTPLSYAVAIIMAYNDFGLWSIVGQIITSNLFTVILFYFFLPWRPKFHFDLGDVNSLKKYSLNLFFNQFLEYWTQNISGLLLGKSIGAIEMGVYNRSRVFILMPVRNITMVINKTIFPKISQLQYDLKQIQEQYNKIASFQAFFILPAMVGLSLVSEEFIYFILGTEWSGMIPIVKLFAILSIVSSTFALNDTIISAKGRTDLLLKVGFFEKGIYILASFIGIQYGLMGVVYANAIGTFVIMFPKYWLFKKVTEIGTIVHFHNYWKIILNCCIMYLVLYLSNEFIPVEEYGSRLISNIALGIVTYLLLNVIFRNPIFSDLVKLVRNN